MQEEDDDYEPEERKKKKGKKRKARSEDKKGKKKKKKKKSDSGDVRIFLLLCTSFSYRTRLRLCRKELHIQLLTCRKATLAAVAVAEAVAVAVLKRAARPARIATTRSTERAESRRRGSHRATTHLPLRAKNPQQACPRLRKCATHSV